MSTATTATPSLRDILLDALDDVIARHEPDPSSQCRECLTALTGWCDGCEAGQALCISYRALLIKVEGAADDAEVAALLTGIGRAA